MQQMSELVGLLTPYEHVMPNFLAKALLRALAERCVGHSAVGQRDVDRGVTCLTASWAELKMPVLIVWGKQDNLTPLSMAYQIHAGVPDSTLAIYDGCGHLAPGLCASKIAPGLSEFFEWRRGCAARYRGAVGSFNGICVAGDCVFFIRVRRRSRH